MGTNLKFWFVFVIMILPVFILGCGETTGGSGTVEPFADEPMILESVMCLDVQYARPVGITDSFLKSDKKIYIWMYWTNLEDTSTIKAVWFAPDKELAVREESQVITSSNGFGIVWFYVESSLGEFTAGEWTVDIYLDGQLERSHIFSVG